MSSLIFRGDMIIDKVECFDSLYALRRIPRNTPLNDVILTSDRKLLGQCIRKYVENVTGTFRAKPILNNGTLTVALVETRFLLQYFCEFADKDELNRYKLSHPEQYHIMSTTKLFDK